MNQPRAKSRVGAREEERAEAGQRPDALELTQPLSWPEIGTPDHPFPSSTPGHREGKAKQPGCPAEVSPKKEVPGAWGAPLARS